MFSLSMMLKLFAAILSVISMITLFNAESGDLPNNLKIVLWMNFFFDYLQVIIFIVIGAVIIIVLVSYFVFSNIIKIIQKYNHKRKVKAQIS